MSVAARTSVPFFVFLTAFGAIALIVRRGRVAYAEELAGQCDVLGPLALARQAIVTDAMEPVERDMDQEAGD
jgi:hypothetical protein